MKKHCDTCGHAYYAGVDRELGRRPQRCGSPDYNSENYTHEMLMEDWTGGCCRFWSPKRKDGHREK